MSDTNSVMVIDDREIDGYKAEMPMLIASSGDTQFLLITRSGADFVLPGGFIIDDVAAVDDALVESLRALYADREIGEYAIPLTFDASGSMSDDMLRAMAAEVKSIMGDCFPTEMSPRDIEPIRIGHREMMEELRVCAPVMPRERPYHGAPRSIRETRRAQGRGKPASAMNGWKRK